MTLPLQVESKLIFSSMQQFDEEMENYIWSLDGGLWGTLQDAGLALGAVFSLVLVARIAYRAMIQEEGIDILASLGSTVTARRSLTASTPISPAPPARRAGTLP